MSNNTVKKTAVLTGLTMLVGGAETSPAIADMTMPQDVQFQLFTVNGSTATVTDALSFSQFTGPVTSLTGVTFSLDSVLSGNRGDNFSASIQVNGETISSLSGVLPRLEALGYNNTSINGLVGAADQAFYTGSGDIMATLSLTCNPCTNLIGWFGDNAIELGVFTGLTLTYDFTPTTAVPGPVVGGGLPGLIAAIAGLLGWRSRRKQKSVT
jgi:hypothetical protein